MSLYDAGDIILSGDGIWLSTFSNSGTMNIANLVRRFDIFESLDNHTITADFYIAEGIDLVNEFPLGGEESLAVVMQTPTRKTLVYDFLVESVIAMKTNEQSNLRSYVLRCTTKDFLKNSSTVFSKRYKDLLYHEALDVVINNDLNGQIQLKTNEETKGYFDYVVNNVRPFQVVDIIKERAVSTQYKSSTFVFYQDNEGYHFQTVEKLIEDRKGQAADKTFFLDTAHLTSDYGTSINVRNILAYETLHQGSSVTKVMNGALRNQIRQFDLHRGTYYLKEEYNNPVDHKKFVATDDKNDFNSGDYNSMATNRPGITRMAIKDGTRKEMEHNKNIHFQRAFVERMRQYSVRVRTYGDTNIRVGDVIALDLPVVSGATERPKGKIFVSNYIVTNLKHQVERQEDGKFNHFLVMDVSKPNQFKQPLG